MPNSPEESFYSQFSQSVADEDSINHAASEFYNGKRYSIVADSLDLQPLPCRNLTAELGCGNGSRLLYLKQKYGFSSSIGIDLCFHKPQSNKETSSSFLSSNLNYEWPIQSGTVDVLMAMMILEHLFDPWFSFSEIKRLLSPNGRAFVNLPLVTSIKNTGSPLLGRLPVTSVPYRRWSSEKHSDGFHLHYFNLASIYHLAARLT